MIFFIQVNKETNRVEGYSSAKLEDEHFIEIELDSNNLEYEELFRSPMIFLYKNNTFIKDVELQEKLLKEKENNIPDSQKIINLTKELASNKLENMKKDQTIKMLTSQQAAIMLDIMKLKGSN